MLTDLTADAGASAAATSSSRSATCASRFPTDEGLVNAVSDLSYDARLGRTLAIVGESGSGKSVSSMAVLGPAQPASAR